MENLKAVAGFLMMLSGILCALSILISLLRMFTTEEGENYKIKIKNSIVAFTLVSSICVFINLFSGYFDTAEMGIGTTDKEIGMLGDSAVISDKDVDEREIIIINNIKYVVTDRNVNIAKNNDTGEITFIDPLRDSGIKTFFNIVINEKVEGTYDVLRLYSESQDFYKGYFATVRFYRKHTDELENKYNQNKSNINAYCTFNNSTDTSDNAGSLISSNGSNID